MRIRSEKAGDEAAIRALTLAAFEPMAFSDGSEADIVDRLRADDDLALSLVATEGDEIVGHVAFSPVLIGGERGWFGLGPVSARPDRQRRGIGSRLIADGMAVMEERGAAGFVLVGDPDYYGRFGFRSDGRLTYGDVPARYVQWRALGTEPPAGLLRYAPAFDGETKPD